MALDRKIFLLVEVDGRKAATIGLREAQRPLIAETIRVLAEIGIGSILVTGDSRVRAAAISNPGIVLPVDSGAED